MYSINFPKMFSYTNTVLVQDHDAVEQNLKLLLLSDKRGLLGDPYYGMIFKRVLYENNNLILKDLLIDEIYTAINIFMPQVKVSRKGIKIIQERDKLFAKIEAVNLIDYTTNVYEIQLLTENTNI